MTRRAVRRLAWIGVALCLVVLALGVMVRLLGPTPGITEENVGRIRAGMTMEEVEAILGREPDGWVTMGKRRLAAVWHSETGVAFVNPNTDGRVGSASFWEEPDPQGAYRTWFRDNFSPQSPDPLNCLRSLLGW
jgi:hypothetical protein